MDPNEHPNPSGDGNGPNNNKRLKPNPNKDSNKPNNETTWSGKPGNPPKSNGSKICRSCGLGMKSAEARPCVPKGGVLKMICPRNDKKGCGSDPRRNTTSDDWSDSKVGK
jgi:hypothetical protein